MMIRILKNSHSHPFFKAERRMGTHIVTKNGGSAVSNTHGQGSALMSSQMLSQPSQASVPHGSTPDASMAISNAHRSFCKAYSLPKLQARPSFDVDTTKHSIPI